MQLDQPGNGAIGALDGSTASGDATFHGSRQRVWGAGASYALGAATFGFVWTQTTVADATSVNIGSSLAPAQTGTPTSLRFANYEINASYLLTPAWSVAASYTFTDGRYSNEAVSAKPRWNQESLGCSDWPPSPRSVLASGADPAQTGLSESNSEATACESLKFAV